ncbi:histidinol dehydrogenase [Paenibacillus senegalensis]|uniref:histidinol dehydrogenase n=1 Tax=Paenibacillus senegalensis TaxID=1465766 RepID=UPI000289DAD6|nr:histidinol dehydrogenase [Paenibacillus senegalensis]
MRAFSGITCKDMVKTTTIGQLDEQALRQLYPLIQELAAQEQLPAHRQAVQARLEQS